MSWLLAIAAEDDADKPTDLGSWQVGDLIAHLGYGIVMIAEIEDAPAGTSPISVGRYVAGYEAARDVIADQSHQLRRQLEPELLRGVYAMGNLAWSSLDNRREGVVIGRRGPLRLRDYLATRLIEVVVHADDLARALGRDSSAFADDAAVETVSDAFSAAHFERWGTHRTVTDHWTWIRTATGRLPDLDGGPPLLG